MTKDKLISKNNGNHNHNTSSSDHANAMGTSLSNYTDGVGMGFSGMGSYQTIQQTIGTGITSQGCPNSLNVRINNSTSGREWGGGNMGMGASYGGGSIGTTGVNTNDGMGNSSQSQNSQSETEMMHFARIIRLYYMVMYHIPLYSCLKLLYAHLNPNNPNKSALYNVIRDLCSKPRTLKQMSRVIIYNAVGQRPALTVNKLPLPTALREYVLSFEP